MGIAMPNATVIVQNNAAPPEALGPATSTRTFLRSVGGSLGIAVSGGVTTATLREEAARLPSTLRLAEILERGTAAFAHLSSGQQQQLADVYRHAIHASLVTGGFVMGLALLITLWLVRTMRRA